MNINIDNVHLEKVRKESHKQIMNNPKNPFILKKFNPLLMARTPSIQLSENISKSSSLDAPVGKIAPEPAHTPEQTFETICAHCSVGCKLTFHHRENNIINVTRNKTEVNQGDNQCMYATLSHHIFNRTDRITKPLVKENGEFREITYENAYKIIEAKLKSFEPEKSAFFIGARLTNEEQYLIQKFARAAVGTNNVDSFHYFHSVQGYANISCNNVPFEQIANASRIFLIGSEIDKYNPAVGNMINSAPVPFEVISIQQVLGIRRSPNKFVHILSYYHFIKAVNHFILSNNLQNTPFIDVNCDGFDEYKESLLKENYYDLCKAACDCNGKCIEEFAIKFIAETNAIMIFSEREISQQTALEFKNLALIAGKYDKPSSGIIALLEQNNTCGLFYMGNNAKAGADLQKMDSAKFQNNHKDCWGVNDLPTVSEKSLADQFFEGEFNNILIFGEDPVGTSEKNPKVLTPLEEADFILVQDIFMTETAKRANLILPASFWFEIGGTFTNTQGVTQGFSAELKSPSQKTSIEQLLDLHKTFGLNKLANIDEIRAESLSLFRKDVQPPKHKIILTNDSISESLFNHGCDYLMSEIDKELDGIE